MPLSPPPSSEVSFFFFSLSPRLPGRGTLPFVSKGTLSLSFPLLFSFFLIHRVQRAKEREGEVFHLDQEGHRDDLASKEQIMRQERETSPCICPPVFCAVFRSLRFRGE